jgi:hypothetical protein
MAIAEVTLKSILLESMETFDSGGDWQDATMRERLAEHLAAGLEARNARADGVKGFYNYGSFDLGIWALDALEGKYDTASLTDADIVALAQEMAVEYDFPGDDEEFDRALRKAARAVGLPRLDGRVENPDEEEEDDSDEEEGWEQEED